MYIDYKNVLISGIIAGILIGVGAIAGCCCWIVDAIVLLGAGALTVYLSKGRIGEQNDLLVNGAAAGLVGGASGGVIYTIISTLLNSLYPTLLGSSYYENYSTICGSSAPSTLSSGIAGVICCLPVFIIAGIALGALGALAYRYLNKQPPGGTIPP